MDEQHSLAARGTADQLNEILERGRARRVLDHRTEDEILGYGLSAVNAVHFYQTDIPAVI